MLLTRRYNQDMCLKVEQMLKKAAKTPVGIFIAKKVFTRLSKPRLNAVIASSQYGLILIKVRLNRRLHALFWWVKEAPTTLQTQLNIISSGVTESRHLGKLLS